MASASKSLTALMLALLGADLLPAQAPAPLRLSFAGAVREATGASADTAPAAVTIAGFRSDAAGARVRQARSALLPNLSLTGSWVNRTFNPRTLGFQIPGLSLPSLVPPFNAYDGRARVTQTLFDASSMRRVGAARGQLNATNAERTAVVETAAQNVALAYVRAARAEAVVEARQADSALAAELVGLAVAQQRAGVSASIDVTRAKTQLAEAAGRARFPRSVCRVWISKPITDSVACVLRTLPERDRWRWRSPCPFWMASGSKAERASRRPRCASRMCACAICGSR